MSGHKARGFLEVIGAQPGDDSPRLIFADWLEEEGDSARAEFIRVQVERACLPEWDARQVRLQLRERALLEQHGQQWKAELPGIKGVSWGEWRRGFVATATFASFAVLRANASACWAATPIEAISVRWPRRRESIASLEPIAGLRELTITGTLVDYREVDQLANAPLLSTLRALNASCCNLGVEGFRRLVVSPYLWKLKALRVPCNSIGNEGVRALFDAPALASLEELDLSERGHYGRYGEDPIIEAHGLESLAAWSGMARLRSLDLSGNAVGPEGLRALLRSPQASGLKELAFRAHGLTGQALQEFEAARPGLQLDVLDLGVNLFRDHGASYLASAPCLHDLKALRLDRCELTSASVHRLARAPFLASLRRLNVVQNNIDSAGLRALFDAKPRELHTLEMSNNEVGDEGVSQLAKSPASNTLLELDLERNHVGDAGAEALAKSKHLKNLLILRLYDNPLVESATALARSPLGKRLAVLDGAGGAEDIPF